MESTDNPKEEKELNKVNNELEENSNSINVEENSVESKETENVTDNSNTVISDNADGNEPSADEIIDVVSESIEKDSSLLIDNDVVNLDIANVVAKRKKGKGKKGKKKNQTVNDNQKVSFVIDSKNDENNENKENNSSNNDEENEEETAVVAEEVATENEDVQENVEQDNENVSNVDEETVQENPENDDNAEDSEKTDEEKKDDSGKKNTNKKKKKKKKQEVAEAEEEIIAIEEVKENAEEKAKDSKKEKKEENKEVSTDGNVKVKKKHNVKKILFITLGILLFAACTCLGIAYYDIKTTRIEFNMVGEDVVIEAGQAKYEESGFVATRNDKDIKEEVKVESNVNDEVVGEYTVSYNLKIDILGYDHTLVRHVTIHDTTPPELNVESEDEIVVYIGDEFNVPAYSASDSYDGDLTEKVEVDNQVDNNTAGTYTITYTVADSSNNTSTKTITVKVERKKNPKIVVSISEQTLYYYFSQIL